MDPDFVKGLEVMLMGMGVVFAALTLVMLAIMALDRLFKGESPEEPAPVAKPAAVAPVAVAATKEQDKDIVAVIALALALRLQETEQSAKVAPVKLVAIQDDSRLWAAVGKLQ